MNRSWQRASTLRFQRKDSGRCIRYLGIINNLFWPAYGGPRSSSTVEGQDRALLKLLLEWRRSGMHKVLEDPSCKPLQQHRLIGSSQSGIHRLSRIRLQAQRAPYSMRPPRPKSPDDGALFFVPSLSVAAAASSYFTSPPPSSATPPLHILTYGSCCLLRHATLSAICVAPTPHSCATGLFPHLLTPISYQLGRPGDFTNITPAARQQYISCFGFLVTSSRILTTTSHPLASRPVRLI